MKNLSDSTNKKKSTSPSNRRDFIKKASTGGLRVGLLGSKTAKKYLSEEDKNFSDYKQDLQKHLRVTYWGKRCSINIY